MISSSRPLLPTDQTFAKDLMRQSARHHHPTQVIYNLQNSYYEPKHIKQIENIIYKLIWKGPDKIKRKILVKMNIFKSINKIKHRDLFEWKLDSTPTEDSNQKALFLKVVS